MTLREVLQQIKKVKVSRFANPVEHTVASELCGYLSQGADVLPVDPTQMKSEPGTLCVAIASQELTQIKIKVPRSSGREWVHFSCEESGGGWLVSSKPYFLYTAFTYLVEDLLDQDFDQVKNWTREMSFAVEKSTFDLFLTQYARLIRDFS